jgi:Protein of unknown function (DUF2281)
MPTVDLSILPVDAQQELLDFYEFLQKKYVVKTKPLESKFTKTDFKTFILSIPKSDGIEFERQRDYPMNQTLAAD